MIRHISIFTLEDKSQIPEFLTLLEATADSCPLITACQVGTHLYPSTNTNQPGPDFGDVVQIIDFQTAQDAADYPTSQAHQRLIKEGPVMAKVTAIDFEFSK